MSTNNKTPAMLLQEFTVKRKIPAPEYDLIVCNSGSHENEFQFRVSVANIEAIGIGRSKQVARHDAAFKALKCLTDKGIYDMQNTPVKDFNSQLHRNEPDHPSQGVVNCIGTLQDLCVENKLPQPYFVEISDVGPSHCRQFTYECQLASVKTQAIANTKKQAKQLAAKYMLEKIKDIIPALTVDIENMKNVILSNDEEALSIYMDYDFFNVIPDKTARIADFPYCLLKLMEERSLNFQSFEEFFSMKPEVALKNILQKLDLQYQVVTMQESPVPIVLLNISTDTPFCIMGVGPTLDIATKNAVDRTFNVVLYHLAAERVDTE